MYMLFHAKNNNTKNKTKLWCWISNNTFSLALHSKEINLSLLLRRVDKKIEEAEVLWRLMNISIDCVTRLSFQMFSLFDCMCCWDPCLPIGYWSTVQNNDLICLSALQSANTVAYMWSLSLACLYRDRKKTRNKKGKKCRPRGISR